MGIDSPTYLDGVLNTCQPYISAKITLLTVREIIDAYFGFNHAASNQRHQIIDTLESQLINISMKGDFSISDIIYLLKHCSEAQIGSQQLIKSLQMSATKFINE